MSLFFSLGVILGALLVSSLGGWGVVVLNSILGPCSGSARGPLLLS